MHDSTQQNLIAAVSGLARLLAIQGRVEQGIASIFRDLEGQGFGRRAVQRAIDVMNADLDDEADDLKQTQAILAAMSSPVQIEAVGRIEAPMTENEFLESMEDAGRWARLCGEPRRYTGSFDEEARRAFLAGWDDVNAVLMPPEEEGISV